MSFSELPTPEERLSATFDTDQVDDRLTAEIGESRTAELTAEWEHLRSCLQSLPVRSAKGLSEDVAARIRDAQPMVVAKAANPSSRSRNDRVLQWTAVLTSCAALFFVCVTLMSEYRSSPKGSSQFVSADGRSIAPEDWEVIVVTVPDDALTGPAEFVRSSVANHGLQIFSLAEESVTSSEQPNILMASGNDAEAIHSIFSSQTNGFSAEVNPRSIDGLNRDELVRRVIESMKVPTKSDEYFGEMFVVLPENGSIVARSIPHAGTAEERMIAGTSLTRTETTPDDSNSADGEVRVSDYLKNGNGKPVLVVLRRNSKLPDDAPQGRNDSFELQNDVASFRRPCRCFSSREV